MKTFFFTAIFFFSGASFAGVPETCVTLKADYLKLCPEDAKNCSIQNDGDLVAALDVLKKYQNLDKEAVQDAMGALDSKVTEANMNRVMKAQIPPCHFFGSKLWEATLSYPKLSKEQRAAVLAEFKSFTLERPPVRPVALMSQLSSLKSLIADKAIATKRGEDSMKDLAALQSDLRKESAKMQDEHEFKRKNKNAFKEIKEEYTAYQNYQKKLAEWWTQNVVE